VRERARERAKQDRRHEPQYVLPEPPERRNAERREPPTAPTAPVTPADYHRWLAERATLRGLLLEAGEVSPSYQEDVSFQSLMATRAKLARIEKLIEDYEARTGEV
jgi:hypothetical protein